MVSPHWCGRLVAEAPDAGCQVFWGAGDELGQALPLVPFLDGLRVREPSTNPRRTTIVRLLRGEVAADRGTDVPAALAEQLLALVTEQCATRPTILVVDDLQWADPASVTLWGRLARSARQVPLLLIGMMRPVPQRDDLLALRRTVDERPGSSSTALTDHGHGRPGRDPGRVASRTTDLLRLADGAAGNPLYVTELVAALTRSSSLTVTDAGTVGAGQRLARRSSLSAAIADRARLRDRADPGGAEGRGPAGHGVRRPRSGRRAGPERGRPDRRRWTRPAPPACWPSPATAWGSGIR